MIALVVVGVLAFQYAMGVEGPPIGDRFGNICDALSNGRCGTKHCTFANGISVSCSCDTFDESDENHLLARGKPVTMSSQYHCARGFCFPGSKAVDGLYKPPVGVDEYSSIAHTYFGDYEWIQIDLEESRCISAVKIWNRDVVASRFQNPLITIGETENEVADRNLNSPAVCAYHPGQPQNVERFDCGSRMFGRYVRVTMRNLNYLNLYEIEVIGL